jgi:hypothetical protein
MPETKDIKTLYKNLKEFESAFSLLVVRFHHVVEARG